MDQGSMDHVHGPGPWTPCHGPGPWTVFFIFIRIRFCTRSMDTQKQKYSRTPLFRTRLIRSPRYFEGRSNSLGFTLPLYASPVISKPRYFELFPISLGTSKQRGSTVVPKKDFTRRCRPMLTIDTNIQLCLHDVHSACTSAVARLLN